MSAIRFAKYFTCALLFTAILSEAPVLASPPADTWEYGELWHYQNAGSTVGPNKTFEPEVDWLTGDGYVEVYGWEALAEKLHAAKLKIDVPKDTKPPQADSLQRIRLLNHLGSQGWELVTQNRNERGESHWIFKRRVVK